jgi:exopolysaccharide production protein ExoQ
MNSKFKFKTITLLVFCIYLFWDFFGLDLTISKGAERLPIHRLFIGATFLIFLLNFQAVIKSILKNKALLTLILYVLISSYWSYNSNETIKDFLFLLSALSITIMTVLSFNHNKLKLIQILFWLFFILVIASIVTALRYPQYGVNILDFGRPRWIGITVHPNKLGALCLALVWLSISLFFLSMRFYEKSFAVIGIICAFYSLKGADSMTSIVASLFILAYNVYHYMFGNKSLSVKISFFTLVAVTVITVTTLYMSSTEIVDSTLKSSGRDTTLSGRSRLWAIGFDSIQKNPFLGLGFDDLEQLTKENHVLMNHLHNGYIELTVKGGATAMIIFIFILTNTLLKQFRFRKLDPEAFIFLNSGLAGILIHNMAESSIMRGLNSLNILMFFIFVSTSLFNLKKSTFINTSSFKKSIFRTNYPPLNL